MAQVSLVDYTGKHYDNPPAKVYEDPLYDKGRYAAALLCWTKNTRLSLSPSGMQMWLDQPMEDLERELEYMASTIPSSWEMIDMIFSIQNVTRACAQQMTRTRQASYAMSSQRVVDMSGVTFSNYLEKGTDNFNFYNDAIFMSLNNYQKAIGKGMPLEDARGLLPLNVHCNLIAKYNLRTLIDLVRNRDSLRVQGEYVDIVRQMKEQVIAVWPWAEIFFKPKNEQAVALIEEVACELNKEQKMKLAKASDLIKKG